MKNLQTLIKTHKEAQQKIAEVELQKSNTVAQVCEDAKGKTKTITEEYKLSEVEDKIKACVKMLIMEEESEVISDSFGFKFLSDGLEVTAKLEEKEWNNYGSWRGWSNKMVLKSFTWEELEIMETLK